MHREITRCSNVFHDISGEILYVDFSKDEGAGRILEKHEAWNHLLGVRFDPREDGQPRSRSNKLRRLGSAVKVLKEHRVDNVDVCAIDDNPIKRIAAETAFQVCI